jgi:hypothetical protein
MQNDCFKEAITFRDRLTHEAEAERLRRKALTVPTGNERQALLQKARQIETAAHFDEWLSSASAAMRRTRGDACDKRRFFSSKASRSQDVTAGSASLPLAATRDRLAPNWNSNDNAHAERMFAKRAV